MEINCTCNTAEHPLLAEEGWLAKRDGVVGVSLVFNLLIILVDYTRKS